MVHICYRRRTRGSQIFKGLLLITIGTMFLIDRTGMFDVNVWQYWPVLVILVGARMVACHVSGEPKESGHD